MRASAGAALGAAALLVAAPAHAHGNAQLGDFYQGLFQPVFHPEFLLGALALALWSTQQAPRTALAVCVGFAAAALVGGTAAQLGLVFPASIWGPRAVALGVGPLVAARLRVPFVVGALVGVGAGLAHGHAATAAEVERITRPVPWVLGLGLGALLLGLYAHALTQRSSAFWMQVAVRVAGSWIAAIGLLVTVMAVRTA